MQLAEVLFKDAVSRGRVADMETAVPVPAGLPDLNLNIPSPSGKGRSRSSGGRGGPSKRRKQIEPGVWGKALVWTVVLRMLDAWPEHVYAARLGTGVKACQRHSLRALRLCRLLPSCWASTLTGAQTYEGHPGKFCFQCCVAGQRSMLHAWCRASHQCG